MSGVSRRDRYKSFSVPLEPWHAVNMKLVLKAVEPDSSFYLMNIGGEAKHEV